MPGGQNAQVADIAAKNNISTELCGVRLIMTDVRDAMANILDRTSLACLVERAQAEDLAWDYMI